MTNQSKDNKEKSENKTDKRFEYLPHTADTKFRAYGSTMEEQFANAALAVFNVITDTTKIKKKLNKSITVYGTDLKALLYNFLEELLFHIDTEQFLLHSVEGMKINRISGKYMLSCLLSGDKANDANHSYETHGDIKAITYAEMEITEHYVQAVLDI